MQYRRHFSENYLNTLNEESDKVAGDLTVGISGNWLIRDGIIPLPMLVLNLDLTIKCLEIHKKYVVSGDSISVNCTHLVKMKSSILRTSAMLQNMSMILSVKLLLTMMLCPSQNIS